MRAVSYPGARYVRDVVPNEKTCPLAVGTPADLSSTVGLGDDMKAGQLIAKAAFDPAQLNAIKKAFDDAWNQIAPYVSSRAEAVEAGRLRLASIVLSVAKRGILEPKQLTDEALRLMSFPPREL